MPLKTAIKVVKSCINNFSCFIYCLLSIFFLSCGTSYKISINQDGSANVIASLEDTNQMEIFYNSELISDLLWNNKNGINFSIKTIDSLGNYLSPIFNKNIFHFEHKQDTLIIKQREGLVFKNYHASCCHLYIEINSYCKIKSIQTKNPYIKQKKNKVIISKSKRSFKTKDKNLNLVIIFLK